MYDKIYILYMRVVSVTKHFRIPTYFLDQRMKSRLSGVYYVSLHRYNESGEQFERFVYEDVFIFKSQILLENFPLLFHIDWVFSTTVIYG